ncbi:uncharacterized protein LOC128271768 [Anopheles cruzii]|uniref:uncharacterized protein LOC128271768 n=1 Tax=Anopheles cruzii TaxID=68878 RepID=UPI0022EC8CF4|nr:uncharacterized protein LOC128271768 [Anopheles cruzii]
MWKYVSRRIRDVYDKTANVLEVRRTWNCGPGERFCVENPPEEGAPTGSNDHGANGRRYCLLHVVRPMRQLDRGPRKEYGTGSNQSDQEGFNRQEPPFQFQHSWYGAITWTSAIICGWYASQLMCLNRRTQRLDHRGGRCFSSHLLRTASAEHGRLPARHCKVLSALFGLKAGTVNASPRFDGPPPPPIAEPKNHQHQHHHRGVRPSFGVFGGLPFGEFVDYTDPHKTVLQNFAFRINNERKPSTGAVYVPEEVPVSVSAVPVKPEAVPRAQPETVESAFENLLSVLGEIEYQLGCRNLQLGEYSAAVSHLKLGASHQHAGAAFNLGICYEQGYGLSKDLRMAMECYQLAADQGHPQAMYNLGVFYARGIAGLRPSRSMAKKCFLAAAELGLEEAIRALGPKYRLPPPAKRPSVDQPSVNFTLVSNNDQFRAEKRNEDWSKLHLVAARG